MRQPLSNEQMDGLAKRHPTIMQPAISGRVLNVLVVAALTMPLFVAWHMFGLTFAQFASGLFKLGHFTVLMFPPNPGRFFWLFLQGLGETLAIALLGTLSAALIALPLSLLAARNVTSFFPLRFAVKRFFDIVRSIDILIWALIWIGVVGLGPFAGVLAIMTSDIGAFGKLFTETFEEADQRPVEGVRATGGGRIHEFMFGIWPQISPVILGQVLYFFESNTRSATIIGVVGAGGIGLHLYEQIRTLEWQMVAFIVLMILVTVAIIDFISSRLRGRFMGGLRSAT